MEIRVLRYFLAVAEEETISGAAKVLLLHSRHFPASSWIWSRNWDKGC